MNAKRRRLSIVLIVLALVAGGGTAIALLHDKTAPAAATAGTGDAKQGWRRIEPGGECQCANGGKFSFWERPADPKKVVLFLNGGGVCWDAKMCALTSTDSPGENHNYAWTLQSAEQPDNGQGLFDLGRADNPFAGYSVIYLSSCTGDAHLGNVARKYSPTLTVQHRGLVNGTATLDYLAQHYPDAAQVVVIGKTAGSIAAPIYGGLVADRLPHARVTVFGGQSGAWPDNPDFNAKVLVDDWGAYRAVPAWAVAGLTGREWGIPTFWVLVARHVPGIVLARFDYAYDSHAAVEVTAWMPGHPPDLLSVIDADQAAVEKAGVTLHGYTAPGDSHGIFESEDFYNLQVGGVSPAAWLGQLIAGKSPADVHCDKCH